MSLDADVCVAHMSSTVNVLYDVVVLAGGAAMKLTPLCNTVPKPMLRIGNKPLIWYCLKPWIDQGTQTFFMCVHVSDRSELEAYLVRQFRTVRFEFVVVPVTIGAEDEDDETGKSRTTTSHALLAYLQHKKHLALDAQGEKRDVMVVSCDTLLSGIDIGSFIYNFYSTYSSASVMLGQPLQPGAAAAAASQSQETAEDNNKPQQKERGGKKKGGGKDTKSRGGAETQRRMEYEYVYAALEQEEEDTRKASAGTCLTNSSSSGRGHVSHYRLHFISSDAPPEFSAGFVARRPNLKCCADVCDAHVYLLRRWVAEFIATSAEEDCTLQDYFIPLLARSQHVTFNKQQGVVLDASKKIESERKVPNHWTRDNPILNVLNSVKQAPPTWDNLRVSCTVFTETDFARVCRIHTADNFVAACHEIIAAFDGPVPTAAAASSQNQQPATRWSPLVQMLSPRLLDAVELARIKAYLVRSPVPSRPDVDIKRSIVGSHVQFGSDVHVVNSVVMDGVEIGNNVVIQNSVLSHGVSVANGVTVSNAVLAPYEAVTQSIEGALRT